MDTKNVKASLQMMSIFIKDLRQDLEEFNNEFNKRLTLNPLTSDGINNIISVIFPFLDRVKRKEYYYLYNDLKPSIDYVLNNENFLRIVKIIEREDFKGHSLNHLTNYIQHILNIVAVHNSYIGLSTNPYSKDPKTNYYNHWMANDKLDWMIGNLFDFMRNLLYYIVEAKSIGEEQFNEFIKEEKKHKTLKYFCKPTKYIRLTHDNYITLFRSKDLMLMFARYYNHVKYQLKNEYSRDTTNLHYRHYLQAFLLESLDKNHELYYLYNTRRVALSELEVLSDELGGGSCYKFINYCYSNKFLPSMLVGAYCQQLYELFLYFNKESS